MKGHHFVGSNHTYGTALNILKSHSRGAEIVMLTNINMFDKIISRTNAPNILSFSFFMQFVVIGYGPFRPENTILLLSGRITCIITTFFYFNTA